MTQPGTLPHSSPDSAYAALVEHSCQIVRDPLTNSVFRLAQDYFQDLSSGALSLDDLAGLAAKIRADLITERRDALHRQHGLAAADHWARLHRQFCSDIETGGRAALEARISRDIGGIVFTAHPTFAHAPEIYRWIAERAHEDASDLAAPRAPVTLESEHDAAQAAIARAQTAVGTYLDLVYATAREQGIADWRTLTPRAPSLSSWVGYDLDGRSDIHWADSIALRLKEKSEQLRRYAARLAGCSEACPDPRLADLTGKLAEAATKTAHDAQAFDTADRAPDGLVAAANGLTGEASLTDIEPVIETLRAVARTAETPDATAQSLLVLAAEMQAFGLGTARIQLRINAGQIQTVIGRDLGLQTEDRSLGRLALATLADKAVQASPEQISFGDVALEQSTARRQLMLCAQIRKHVDCRTPIRFLIAESENPATVMGALYLARQYGVDDLLDISPLFETPEALENGGRFIERLISEPVFADYVRRRGQLSVQLGFSDAGRFIGQIAADIAIERIHSLISEALARTLPGTALLIFNTHGESCGRGGYPGSLEDRLDHVLTPWTRGRMQELGVPLRHEVSFQGGDGYLHFGSDALAETTLAAFVTHAHCQTGPEAADPFYEETNLVWDFYRAIRHWQEKLFDLPEYEALISDFAGGFLLRAGSRPVRRKKGPAGPRALRAISHNATLQQLAVPMNTAGGIGSALPAELDELAALINRSPRLRALLRMAVQTRIKTSIPALRGYAACFSPSFWIANAKQAKPGPADARIRVAEHLRTHETAAALSRCADFFSIDLGRFDRLIAMIADAPAVEDRHQARLPLHALHAIRQAVMMRALEISGQLPAMSARHGFEAIDIVMAISQMRLGEAVDQLVQAFPLSPSDQSLVERFDEPSARTSRDSDFRRLHSEIIDPLRQIQAITETVSEAVAHAYRAYG